MRLLRLEFVLACPSRKSTHLLLLAVLCGLVFHSDLTGEIIFIDLFPQHLMGTLIVLRVLGSGEAPSQRQSPQQLPELRLTPPHSAVHAQS